jgi:hypothetical protein
MGSCAPSVVYDPTTAPPEFLIVICAPARSGSPASRALLPFTSLYARTQSVPSGIAVLVGVAVGVDVGVWVAVDVGVGVLVGLAIVITCGDVVGFVAGKVAVVLPSLAWM